MASRGKTQCSPQSEDNRIKVTFKNHKGEIIKEVEANEGDDIVDLSWEYDLDIEGERTPVADRQDAFERNKYLWLIL